MNSELKPPTAHGRGSNIRPPNRFQSVHTENDFEQLAPDDEHFESLRTIPTQYIPDDSRSIISENDSPDIGFRYSLNPYRGCAHGCAYCYARPTHEYLGLNAGLDFETKVFVKHAAPELFRDWLNRPGYEPEMIMFSGVTDCYQPAEREFRLTRACLKVALEARQPVGIVTKNALLVRDLDVLQPMAELGVVSVSLSITTLDDKLARRLEPRTSRPAARLRTIRELRAAGIRVNAMVAPIIPGLNDSEIPQVLAAVADAGANSAAYILLRLPLTVKPVFLDWLEREAPTHRDRVESRIRATRDGELSDSQFGSRMRGRGEMADQIRATFKVFAGKYGLDRRSPKLDTSRFRPPTPSSGQLRLFQ
jgi:DNA repair photolyase